MHLGRKLARLAAALRKLVLRIGFGFFLTVHAVPVLARDEIFLFRPVQLPGSRSVDAALNAPVSWQWKGYWQRSQ